VGHGHSCSRAPHPRQVYGLQPLEKLIQTELNNSSKIRVFYKKEEMCAERQGRHDYLKIYPLD
jgi:hypothetical protein